MYVIVANHVNWHMKNLLSDRENTGKFKMQFKWGPWNKFLIKIHCTCHDFDVALRFS